MAVFKKKIACSRLIGEAPVYLGRFKLVSCQEGTSSNRRLSVSSTADREVRQAANTASAVKMVTMTA